MGGETRAERLFFFVALAVTGAVLWLAPVLPFQDYPNHLHVLEVERALRAGSDSGFLRAREGWFFGYSLYLLPSRALPWLGVEQALRVVVLVSALGLPLAAWALAGALGAPRAWAGLLSLPLALSWPLRMGLLPYVLALPLLLLATRFLVRAHRSGFSVALMLTASACYLAHPLAFGWLLVLALVAGVTLATARVRALAGSALALTPGLLMAGWDVVHGAFRQIPGTHHTWEPSALYFRPLGRAMAQLVTRTWSVTDGATGLLLVPFLLMLAWLTFLWLGQRAPASREQRFCAAAVVLGMLAGLVMPGSLGTTWALGERMAMLGPLFLPLAVAATAARASPRLRGALCVGIALALGAGQVEVTTQARHLERIVGDARLARLEGRFLTFRASDCEHAQRSRSWGYYDPMRHVWAYALGAGGVTPYIFAFAHYLPVVYDGDRFARALRAPAEWDANAWRRRGDSADCHPWDVRQLRGALRYGDFDGVIVFGEPDRMEALAGALSDAAEVQWLSEGMLLLRSAPARACTP
ncbi:hypothetical protein HPC49_21425 [Pyxidicoccus fallax]|uniref:Glycosyltransferase RgtA/B/C/D-like domain-containing protein n=1 Tax=Pyxidicoccus fallax TaxID=394095 RepID=A0A848LIC1_9BACT|nr:hypothetical protein [Pyxidicoccus fallax]NMO17467.1 hypothetical protein [Pyxidicoccus fallax]NPC80774.1 hypothetical protein [Pyxidicoccus fallax]